MVWANKQNLKAILRYALRRQTWSPFSPDPVEFVRLNFDFHPKTVRTWLQENGFAVERQLTVSHFRLALLKRLLPVNALVGMDSLAQLTGDWWQLTPSVFARARALGETPYAPQEAFFCCPNCGHFPLEEESEALICSQCQHHWSFRDGIYDFREPLET